MAQHKRHKELTKADLRLIRDQWDEKTVDELAETIGCTIGTIYRVARVMREMGVKISFKRVRGNIDGLIREVVEEI